MNKLGLLESYEYRLKEYEFNATWEAFSKPLQIFESQSIAVQ